MSRAAQLQSLLQCSLIFQTLLCTMTDKGLHLQTTFEKGFSESSAFLIRLQERSCEMRDNQIEMDAHPFFRSWSNPKIPVEANESHSLMQGFNSVKDFAGVKSLLTRSNLIQTCHQVEMKLLYWDLILSSSIICIRICIRIRNKIKPSQYRTTGIYC